jgi:hypothetical protein
LATREHVADPRGLDRATSWLRHSQDCGVRQRTGYNTTSLGFYGAVEKSLQEGTS